MTYAEQKTIAQRELEKAVRDWNAANRADDETAKTAADVACIKAKEDYNTAARNEFYEACCLKENPLSEACKVLTYSIIGFHDNKNKDTKALTRIVTKPEEIVKLFGLKAYAESLTDEDRPEGIKIGADEEWSKMLRRFHNTVTVRAMQYLGKKPDAVQSVIDSNGVHDVYGEILKAKETVAKAKAGELHGDEAPNPISNTQMLKAYQALVDAMLGKDENGKSIYKVTSMDVNWVIMTFLKRGKKALQAEGGRDISTAFFVAQTCHRLMKGISSYEVNAHFAKEIG